MVDINKKEFYFDIIICIIAIFEICFWGAQEPILLYMGAFVTWGCISVSYTHLDVYKRQRWS